MAYFSHAYKKVFVALGGNEPGLPMEDMINSMFGFFDARTWAPIPVEEATMAEHPTVIFALANPFHSSDKIGVYGGYTESVKSQVIDPLYIERVWMSKSRHARPHFIALGWDEVDFDLTPEFFCGKTYTMRIDVKGSKALRLLGHHLYRRFIVTTPCCADPANPLRIDPVVVLLEFAKQFREDPFFSPFIQVYVDTLDTDGVTPVFVDQDTYVPVTDPTDIATVPAGLRLALLSSDTQFDYSSFDPLDHDETEPLMFTSIQWVDDEGLPCKSMKPLAFTELESALSPEGTPGLLVREFLLSLNYRQEIFPRNIRMRNVQEMENISYDIYGHDEYWNYYILHRVPRKYNPSGVYDQDQYLIQIAVAQDDGDNRHFIEDWLESYLASAGTGVVMEDVSGEVDGA